MRIYCTKYGIFGFGGPQKNEDVARQFGLKKGEILYVVSNVNKKLMEITYNPPDEKASEIEKTLVAILERKSTFMRSRAYKGRLSEVIDDYYAHTSEDSLLEKDYEQSLYRMVERVARESSRKSTWERNMHIYCMRYGILGFDTPRTFEYIGTQFGICRARAQGVISNMDRKLKKIATLSPPSPPASTHGIRPA